MGVTNEVEHVQSAEVPRRDRRSWICGPGSGRGVWEAFFDTVGFDIKPERIRELKSGRDSTKETSAEELALASRLRFTTRLQDLKPCGVMIVTVPTPIDEHKRPELRPLIRASESIGAVLKKGDVVVYESTVYPGCTEEVCVPILERVSGLRFNRDFFAGYSPERINPGDKEHRLSTIRKVTSGSTPEAADFENHVLFDIKYVFPSRDADGRL